MSGPAVDRVAAILSGYTKTINSTPELLSLLYDANMLPEQITTTDGAICVAAICEAYKLGLEIGSYSPSQAQDGYERSECTQGNPND